MKPGLLIIVGLAAIALALISMLALDRLVDLVWMQVFLAVAFEVVILVCALVIRPERALPFLCDPLVLFVTFHAQFFVVGPLAFPYTSAYALTPVSSNAVVATLLGFIGLLSMFLVGYHAPLGSLIARRLPSFDGRRAKFPGRWAEGGVLLVCLSVCGYYITSYGGIRILLHRGYGSYETGAWFIAPFLLLVVATLLLAWRVFAAETRTWSVILLFAAVVGFEVLFWGFLLSQRKWLFYLFFGITGIFLLRRGTRAIPRFVLPTVLMILVVYLAFWGNVRARPLAGLIAGRSDPRFAEIASLQSGYLESVAGPFGAACLVLQIFPEREPFRYGQTLLVGLLSPIPRAIWPGKPIGLGKELTWYLGTYYAASYDTTKGLSITPTLVGDFYANLGVAGILIGGLLLGLACRIVAAYAVHGMRDGLQFSPARVLVPSVFLAGLVELRADIAMLIVFYMYTMIPLALLLTFFSFEPEGGRYRELASSRAH